MIPALISVALVSLTVEKRRPKRRDAASSADSSVAATPQPKAKATTVASASTPDRGPSP